MEETRKRESEQNDDEDPSSSAEKRPRVSEEGGCGGVDVGEDIMAWLSMDDDTMNELMNFLDTTNAESENLTRVKFIDNPYSSPLIFQTTSSYITINGNEESCGSSFSDSESSVMVSVDTGGIVNVGRECGVGAWRSNELDGGGFLKGGEMEGCSCNGSDLDDYVLARFLVEEEEEALS